MYGGSFQLARLALRMHDLMPLRWRLTLSMTS